MTWVSSRSHLVAYLDVLSKMRDLRDTGRRFSEIWNLLGEREFNDLLGKWHDDPWVENLFCQNRSKGSRAGAGRRVDRSRRVDGSHRVNGRSGRIRIRRHGPELNLDRIGE